MAESRANKRTKAQVEWDRMMITRMYLRGKSQTEIVEAIRGSRPYTLSQQQISYDLKAVREQWKKARHEEIDAQKAEEIARLDELEREAWEAYEASAQDAEQSKQILTINKTTGQPNPVRVEKTTIKRTGDFRYLAVVHDCITQRCRVKGINAPEKIAHTNKEGTEDIPPLTEEQRLAEIGALLSLAKQRATQAGVSDDG